MQILVVADEARIVTFVSRALRAEAMTVAAATGREVLPRVESGDYDLAILDLALRDRDGLELLDEMHARRPELPVLVLSALADLETKLRAFSLGASDFLARPFSLDELLARVRVQARRRANGTNGRVLHAGELDLDLARRETRFGGRTSQLTDGEFRLLTDLFEHAGEIVSREALLAHVWGYDFDPHSNVVDVCVGRLRKKIGPGAPIQTVRKAGYRLLSA